MSSSREECTAARTDEMELDTRQSSPELQGLHIDMDEDQEMNDADADGESESEYDCLAPGKDDSQTPAEDDSQDNAQACTSASPVALGKRPRTSPSPSKATDYMVPIPKRRSLRAGLASSSSSTPGTPGGLSLPVDQDTMRRKRQRRPL